ncbi:MAG: hypothetical protein PHZ24_02975 [Bacteroidales bacterium]|nr:hypothetical protein [Bacteroidales bacterium]MDY0141588.1 hypothetical protein [Bacteroidales bacterium]
MSKFIKILVVFAGFILSVSASAQFYNGHQMKFGKNRVQYDEFDWFYFRYQKFDTYFYAGSKDIALEIATIANNYLIKTETFFEHQLNQRIVFVIYQNLSDFRQSNIGLNTGDAQYNIGGVTKVVDNIAFIYVEGDIASLEQQVKAAIANIILNEMLYGLDLKNKIANNTLITMPEWYIKGLIAYVSQDWDTKIDEQTKMGILSGDFDNFNQLTGKDAEIAGMAIWNYIASTYSPQVIPNIVYLTRVTKNMESGFLYVLGSSLTMLQANWNMYYKMQYETFDLTTTKPESKNLLKRNRRNVEYYQLQFSENANKIAWVENKLGKYWIKVKDIESGKTKTVFRREHKLDQIIDYTYPVLRWHPTGKLLGFVIEKNGEIYYTTYNFETEDIKEIQMTALEKMSSFDYSNDGLSLVLAGFNNGQSDLFIFNITANTLVNITRDYADDFSPIFINNSKQIIFSSHRDTEQLGDRDNNFLPTQKHTDIFVYDIASKKISQITNSKLSSETQPGFTNNSYIFLSDENGINNLYSANIDSAISFIDTTTHYRFYLNKSQLTNYSYNIRELGLTKFSDANTFLYKNEIKFDFLHNETLPLPISSSSKTMFKTSYEKATQRTVKKVTKPELEIDSLSKLPVNKREQPININNYIFEAELLDDVVTEDNEFEADGRAKEPRTGKYQTSFYTNYLVSQIDYGFLSNSYQTFTGSAFYFNPGFNLIFKLGTSDLFEDYRITAGFRFAGNFDSNEYLLSFENLKKRWNKQLILHRQALNNFKGYSYVKTFTHEAFYVMRYPLSQVDAFQFTGNLRQNHNSILSVDYQSLLAPEQYDYWASLKAEYIFDNTKEISTNILNGFRMKAFAEVFKQLDKKETDMLVTGADLRYYKPIHKNLIFAARFATSASFGKAKLIYYLGGIDNWINLSAKKPTFNDNIRIDPTVNYAYQAVATNLRGFSQNIRNGTNFAVFNAEIRWPIFSYIYKRPINSDFIKHFQFIGFFDIGSAWTGLSPFGGNNAYENDYYENNPVTIIIHNDNFPIVSGYGFGMRTKLFGYFIRADWAWGIENNIIQDRMFYLSLSTDF